MRERAAAAFRRRGPLLVAVAAALVAAVPRLTRAWASREEILLRSTWDDSYYYFAIARNIMRGHGASFDGEHVTNGFHPLWLALITPCWALEGDVPLHLALTLGAVLGAVTAALVVVWLHEATSSLTAAATGGLFFALHPGIVDDSVNGLESAIAVAMLAVVLVVALRLPSRAGGRVFDRATVVFGSSLGLLMLARTDMVFIAAGVLLFAFVRAGPAAWPRSAAAGAVASAWLVPWFVWSLLATGSIVQVSGRAGGLLVRQAFEARHGDGFGVRVRHGIGETWELFRSDLAHAHAVPGSVDVAPALAALVCLGGLVCWYALARRDRPREGVMLLSVAGMSFLAMLAYHQGIRLFVRSWYFAPGGLLLALGAGLVVAAGRELIMRWTAEGRGRALLSVGGMVVVAGALVVVYKPYSPMRWRGEVTHQRVMYEAATWLRDETPPGTRAGAFNAGIIGYYSGRTVMNLDGVVNESAFEALRDCDVTSYVRDERLDYVTDFRAAFVLANCGPAVVTFETVTSFGPDAVFGYLDAGRVVSTRAPAAGN